MSTAFLKDAPPLVDLGDCHDVFLSGIAKIERLPGNCLRFVCYVEETDGREKVRKVVARMIWPMGALPLALRQTAESLTTHGGPLLAEDGELSVILN